MLVLKVLGLILLIILILVTFIILIPYTYVIKSSRLENEFEFSLSWLFGMIGVIYIKYFNKEDELYLRIFNMKYKMQVNSNNKAKKEKDKKKNNYKKNKDNKRNIKLKDHINKEVINKLIILIKKVLKSIKPKELFINMRFGFNDPMYTGILYALYCQFSYLFIRYSISFQPSFDEEGLKGKYLIRGRIWIFYLLMVILGFLFSAPIRNEIKLIMKKKGGAQYGR